MSQSTNRPEQGAAGQIIETIHLGTEIRDSRAEVPIRLRTLKDSDALHFFRMAPLGYFHAWTHSGNLSEEGARKYITSWRRWASIPTRWRTGGPVISRPDTIHVAIILRSIGYAIGFCKIAIEHDVCKVEIAIEAVYQNQGYGTQALIMIIDWAFTRAQNEGLQMNTVQLTAPQANPHFQYVMESKMRLGSPILIRQELNFMNRWTVRHNEWIIAATRVLNKYQDEA